MLVCYWVAVVVFVFYFVFLMVHSGKLLFLVVVSIVFISRCLLFSVMGSVYILFIMYMKAANFCFMV
jgi:hypothetical protein